MGRPALLLLDEPFYAFDPQTRRHIRAELGRVLRAARTATVLVSHQASDLAELADRHLRLQDGRLPNTGRRHRTPGPGSFATLGWC